MAQGRRDRLSGEQRIDMWRRWKAGESLHEIGRAFAEKCEFGFEVSSNVPNVPKIDGKDDATEAA